METIGKPSAYAPLNPARKEIRILHIEDTLDLQSRVQCRLETVSLLNLPGSQEIDPEQSTKAPFYEAMSWSRGDTSLRTHICVDGQPFEVSKNAESVLRQLCLEQKHWIVWMDAVCINQSDMAERQQQVAIMRDVYKRAARVLAWLGESVKWTKLAFRAIDSIVAHVLTLADDQPLWSILERGADQLKRHYDLPQDDSYHSGAVVEFYSSAWFSRVWIVQEVLLGASPVCYCGSESRSWWHIGLAAAWLSRVYSFRGEESGYGGPKERIIDASSHIWETSALKAPRGLDSFLIMSMARESTLPHDRVYGILGLVEDRFHNPSTESEIVVDYTADLATVYASATRAALMSSPANTALDILQYAQYARVQDPGGKWPSWVPQYHAKDAWERGPIPAVSHAARDTPYETYHGTLQDPTLLMLSGVYHSRVDRCTECSWDGPRGIIKWMLDC